jgi:transcriptional regulator of acetoin/glycerol metabolism
MAGTGSVVVVADRDGLLLSSVGDPEFTSSPLGRHFVPGVSWSERVAGTNAIGTCIATRAAVTVEKGEHFLAQFRSLCGSAAPVFDSTGDLAGVLAAYGTEVTAHTLGFIRTIAVMIENRMLEREMSSELVIRFHPVAEYIGTIKQGIAAFGMDGKLLASNTAARSILRISVEKAATTHFNDVFCLAFSLPRLLARAHEVGSAPMNVSLADGREITLIASAGANSALASRPTLKQPSPPPPPDTGQDRASGKGVQSRLADLDLGDPLMHRAIVKASMILGSDIPLLIEGESGVGKEVFTAAFHNSGPRHKGPFVAVNCAAVPEGLIESELFGYEEGAFTGAKRKGYQGKLLQANGGTLFLDEIGDMPLSLQGRLLRVLQERQVTPLGSAKSVPVDLSIVCATHRTMLQEVAEGRFRQDLYYRLNGLRVQLPALRQRQDIGRLIDLLINTEGGGRKIDVDFDVLQALRTHPWPGNIRQLQMVLRTALAILGGGNRLTLDHLPDEFVQAHERDEAPSASAAGEGELARVELEAIRKAVAATDGNMSKAARMLGISRKTLYRKLGKLHATPADQTTSSDKHG